MGLQRQDLPEYAGMIAGEVMSEQHLVVAPGCSWESQPIGLKRNTRAAQTRVICLSSPLGSHLGAVEVQVGTGWRRAALILISGAVDRRTVRVLRWGTGTEQAQLAYLHPGPELDWQCRHVGQFQRHVPGETRVDPARRRMRQQAEPAEAGIVGRDVSWSGQEKAR